MRKMPAPPLKHPTTAAVESEPSINLDSLVDTLEFLRHAKGAPVESFEDVIEYVDGLRASM